ncbi:MAG TPA: hypothetical protein VGG68_09290 [Caulobacteraceae bacterium]|jgi:hypothetical protein
MFRPARTFTDPAAGAGPQRGFPAPGAEEQLTGEELIGADDGGVSWEAGRPTKGARSWFQPAASASAQRGFPAPQNGGQRRPGGSMPAVPLAYGLPIYVETPYYSRGRDAFVPNLGKVLVNPIGAGIVALHRAQASYGPAAQYADGELWWTSQVVPTTIAPQSLTDPGELQAILGDLYVQAAYRTTG